METKLTFFFAAAVMFAAGCSSSAEPTPIPTAPSPKEETSSSPPSTSTSTSTSKPEAETCGSVEQVASTAMLFFDTQPEPAAKGGALSDGVYVLEKVTRYGVESPDEPRPHAERMTLRYVDGVAEFVVSESDPNTNTNTNTNTAKRSSSEVTLNGSTLTAKDTCPGTRTTTLKYTATGNALDLHVQSSGMKFVQHFVRFSGP